MPRFNAIAAIASFQVDPGGYRALMARSSNGVDGLSLKVRQYAGEMPLTNALGLNVGALYSARTSPVFGFNARTAPRWPGGKARAMYCCRSRSIVVWGYDRLGSAWIRRPGIAMRRSSSAETTLNGASLRTSDG